MQNKKKCVSCSNIMDISARVCPLCNIKQPNIDLTITTAVETINTDGYKYCFACGTKIKSMAEMCPSCTAMQPMPKANVAQSTRSRSTAALFAILLGIYGAQRFYLDKITSGIFYVVFSWTYIPFFISLVEAMIIVHSKDDTFNKKYNANNKFKITPCSFGVKVFVTIAFIFIVLGLVFIIFALLISFRQGPQGLDYMIEDIKDFFLYYTI